MHPLMKNSKQNGIVNYIRVILSISIVLSTFNPMLIASAAYAGQVSIGSDTVNPGDAANVSISITNCDNVTGMNLTLTYNESILSLENLNNIAENESVVSGHLVVADLLSAGNISIELRQLDNLTKEARIPVIDISFSAISNGNSTLGLQDVELLGGETSSTTADTVTDGYVLVETITEPNNVSCIPPEPVNFTKTTGNFWILHEWDSGSGNLTDSYNVSFNGSWYNDTFVSEFNDTDLDPHSWSNITVYAYNATVSTLSSGVERNVQLPNNPINITDVPPSVTVSEGKTILVDANFTDLDGDNATFDCNRTDLFRDFDVNTGVGNWTTDYSDAGTYSVEFNVTDGYNSTDYEIMRILVEDATNPSNVSYIPPSTANFTNSTGNFWILHDWEPGSGNLTDSYNVSYNGSWYNDTFVSEFNDTDLDPHSWSNITVYAYNASSSILSSGVERNVQLPNNPINITDVPSFVTVNEGTTITVDANFTDLDGDVAIFDCNRSDLFSDFDVNTGVGNWTTDYSDAGTYSVEFNVTDGYNSTDDGIMNIKVTNVNRQPVFDEIEDQNVQENNTLEFILSATDPDDDDILNYYISSGLPSEATLNSTSGNFSWTPYYNQSGVYNVEFNVSDGYVNISQTVDINVTNMNRPPQMAELQDAEIEENSTLEIDLGAFDPDEDDVLAYSNDLGIGSFSDGNFTWTPGFEDNGTYNILFSVTDGEYYENQSIVINVTDVNRAPVLEYIPSVSVNETENVTIDLIANDPDGDQLNYSTDANFGNLTENTFNWTPNFTHQGTYYINFTVSDGSLSDTKMAVVGVNDTNAAPEFDDSVGAQIINETEYISFIVTASDVDGDDLIYSVSGVPVTATTEYDPAIEGMNFSWTPSYTEAGNYTVKFIVKDEMQYSDVLEVPITVLDVNRAPVFDSLNPIYTINESDKLTINLGANDPDGDPIVVWINNSNNASGTLSDDIYEWETDYLANGTYELEFTVSDGDINTTETTTVVVNDVNAPPEFTDISSKTATETETISFVVNATDIDNDPLNYSVVGTLPNGSTFNNDTLQFKWTPSDGQEGSYSIQFQVSDGEDSDEMEVSVTVIDNDDPGSSSTSSSGGGGGGGGSMSTGEDYENIAFKDYVLKAVVKDVESVFSFYEQDNVIVSVSFTSKLNGGQVKAVVEMLKDTSSQVNSAAPGDVYKNVNIYIDSNLGPDVIGNSRIDFKVEKSWISEKEIELSTISLYRYSDSKWNQLSTELESEDEEYFYFTSTTPGFSPFAIASVDPSAVAEESATSDEQVVSQETEDTAMSTEDPVSLEPTPETSQESRSVIPFVIILALIGIMVIGIVGYRNKEYYDKLRMQLGNPDGKRYRRVKK